MARVLFPPTVSDPAVEGLRVSETPGAKRIPLARSSGQIDAAWVAGVTEALALLASIVRPDGEFLVQNTQYEDLRFPAVGINPPGAASDPARDNTDGRLSFSSTVDNVIAIQVQMPHAWKEGTTIYPHVHWSPTSTGTGNVVWRMRYKIADVNETFPPIWSEMTTVVAAGGVSDAHKIAEFGPLEMPEEHLSSMMLVLLSRVATDSRDSYGDPAKLNEFDIHYAVNSLGSYEEYEKTALKTSVYDAIWGDDATQNRRLVREWISVGEDA